MNVVTRYTFPTKEMGIVTDCRCDESVLILPRSVLKCTISFTVLAVPNLFILGCQFCIWLHLCELPPASFHSPSVETHQIMG